MKKRKFYFCKKWEQTDEAARDALSGICGRIEASDNLKRRIDCRIESVSVKEEHYMKRISAKRVLIGVAAACLLVGTVGIAGSGIKSYFGSGSIIPDYKNFEELAQAEAQVGYEIKAIENFSNGFKMQGIHIIDFAIQNEAGQTEAEQKELSISYKKGSDKLSFSGRKLMDMENPDEILNFRAPDQSLQVNGSQIIYMETTNKFVPPDYELTEEDKANMEKDNFNLAYGSDEVDINKGYYTGWIENGVIYTFYGADLSISPDEMLNMAKEVIENGK